MLRRDRGEVPGPLLEARTQPVTACSGICWRCGGVQSLFRSAHRTPYGGGVVPVSHAEIRCCGRCAPLCYREISAGNRRCFAQSPFSGRSTHKGYKGSWRRQTASSPRPALAYTAPSRSSLMPTHFNSVTSTQAPAAMALACAIYIYGLVLVRVRVVQNTQKRKRSQCPHTKGPAEKAFDMYRPVT